MRGKTGYTLMAAGLLMLSALTACTVTDVSRESNSLATEDSQEKSVTTAPTLSPGVALTEEEQIRRDMIDRSLLTAGNNYRLKKVIEKARNGEDVTLAYIGGSITEGYNAGTKDNYVKLSYEFFADTYGSRDAVHMVNAGLSGTPSTLGLIRSERDIFSYKPDIVFIEFAVNDSQSGMDPVCFENLVAKALMQEQEPAVVLLYSVIKSGYTCQNQMAITAFNYKLPGISVKNAIGPEIEEGRMNWEDWSNDESHPNGFGQKLYSEFIINLFKTVDIASADEPIGLPDRFLSGYDFTGMQMFDKTNTIITETGSFLEQSGHAAFPNGWVKRQGTGNEGIKLTITAKSFFVVYKEVNNDTYGRAEVYVDGELATNMAGKTSSGWNNPVAAFVFAEDASAEHTIEIRMAQGEEDKAFDLLAFGVCP